MKIEAINFKGIYTNESEVSLPIDYCKDTDCSIRPGYIEAKQYSLNEESLPAKIEDGGTILYADTITLDNDKYGVKYEDAEYKSNYVHNLEYYNLYISDDLIYLIKDGVTTSYPYSGTLNRVLNEKGIVYIFTTTNSYQLQNMDRMTNRTVRESIAGSNAFIKYDPKTIDLTEKYSENGIYLSDMLIGSDAGIEIS